MIARERRREGGSERERDSEVALQAAVGQVRLRTIHS